MTNSPLSRDFWKRPRCSLRATSGGFRSRCRAESASWRHAWSPACWSSRTRRRSTPRACSTPLVRFRRRSGTPPARPAGPRG
nr:MAG TPA: hypothetical protein [Caudoviricetes sp.]